MDRDRIYRDPQNQLVDFAFDEAVAGVFPDMIRRSVPAYETVIPLTGLIAARHLAGAGLPEADDTRPTGTIPANSAATANALVFDLGCSLGATTLALLRQLGDKPCRIVAVDNSRPMLDRATELVTDSRVEFCLRDIRETEVGGAQVVLMNYVLQFLPPADRPALLSRFRKQMAPGGLLLISEKIDFAAMPDRQFFTAAHLAYKKANGYSELEISRKRTALENVMVVDTEEAHHDRLWEAGFSPVRTWFRCLNWASFLAWA